MKSALGWFLITLVGMFSSLRSVAAEPMSEIAGPQILNPEDGWLDLSRFLERPFGFIPVVMPVTEPAVGYGAAAALVFIDKRKPDGSTDVSRPNVAGIGGMATANGTWGVGAVDSRYWMDDRIKTVVGGGYADANLDFYGVGEDGFLQDHPLAYSLRPATGFAAVNYRLTEQSRWWAGLKYSYGVTEVAFGLPALVPPDVFPTRGTFRTAGLTPSLTYDSRDNVFTPNCGSYAEVSAGVYSEALGGEREFEKVGLTLIQFVPLDSRLVLGLRGGARLSFDDTPFYLKPFVSLRGVPAMRYQGDEAVELEAELRWQVWKRFSLVGFAGTGTAWNDFDRFKRSQTVLAGGTGFRYEIARRYGLHMGVDVAFGPDDPTVYIQFGSAWMRP